MASCFLSRFLSSKFSSPRIITRTLGSQYNVVTDEFCGLIERVIGEDKVTVSGAVREHHGKDESYHSVCPPDVVTFPETTSQVSAILELCNKEHVPVIPFGTGTGLEGGVGAVKGGVCIDLNKMDAITEVNSEDFYATVQPGVTRHSLNSYIRDTGLFFPIDPGADASICGMAATSASGTNAVRYGTMKDNVLNLQVVLPSGQVLYTGGLKGRAKKSSAGYNLTNLFVGSEGTLGVITEAVIKLYGVPESTIAAVCGFPSIEAAVTTTVEILQCGIPISRIEFLDEISLEAANKFFNLDYPVHPTLFLEFTGSSQSVEEQTQIVDGIAKDNNAYDFIWEKDHEARAKLWKARHNWWYAGLALRPGTKGFATDVCVPISKLPEVLIETKQDLSSSGTIAPVIGHVGDGNFHCMFLIDESDDKELANAKALATRMARRALRVGGTCTGEHGIGRGKIDLLVEEYGPIGIETMLNIKRSIDPHNIMNPGIIFHC